MTLCVAVRFLQPVQHGRLSDRELEWPPSPLRVFQALVAAAAGRWNERQVVGYAAPALEWLERLPPPEIVAPAGVPSGSPAQLYVPDNTAELQVPAWKRGDLIKGVNRSGKVVRPTRIGSFHRAEGDEREAVRYLYPLDPADAGPHLETLRAAARSLTHLGWGIDMAVGDLAVVSDEEVAGFPGERWRPGPGGVGLRVPRAGTLADLARKHEAFLGRLGAGRFAPVPPLREFDTVSYVSASASQTVESARPFVAFQLLDAAGDRVRAFDTARRAAHVAAWVRHAAGEEYERAYPDGDSFVHGHAAGDTGGQLKGAGADFRLMFLPVPTLEARPTGRHCGAVRRVMVVAPPGAGDRLAWLRRSLAGQDLVWRGEVKAVLNLLPRNDWVLSQYTTPTCEWSTVTPVIWPRHDDSDPEKAERILRQAFVEAGLAPEVVAGIQELEWRGVGFQRGQELARDYVPPEKLTGRRYHVRVKFKNPVAGPLAVGAGRYRGLGLFSSS